MTSRIIILLITLTLASFKGLCCSDSLMLRIIETERQVMYAQDDTVRATLLLKKASVYKQANNYTEAMSTLNRINTQALSSTGVDSLHYEKAFCFFMTGSYGYGVQEMWGIADREKHGKEYNLLYLMLLLENESWDDFKEEYLQQAIQQGVDTTGFSHNFKAPVLKDADHYVRLAKIPGLGLGLFKSGYASKGFTSASLQLLFAGFGAWQIATGYYFTGVLSGVLPARRFYNGGKLLTNSMVVRSNSETIKKVKKAGYHYLNMLY